MYLRFDSWATGNICNRWTVSTFRLYMSSFILLPLIKYKRQIKCYFGGFDAAHSLSNHCMGDSIPDLNILPWLLTFLNYTYYILILTGLFILRIETRTWWAASQWVCKTRHHTTLNLPHLSMTMEADTRFYANWSVTCGKIQSTSKWSWRLSVLKERIMQTWFVYITLHGESVLFVM